MMIDSNLLEMSENNDPGYHPLTRYESWLVAVLNQDESNDCIEDIDYLEYHAQTDEVFILLKGEAQLLISGGKDKPEDIRTVKMRPQKCYNVKAGVWHSIVLANGGTVAIVESSDTSRENSVYYHLSADEKTQLIKHDERGRT